MDTELLELRLEYHQGIYSTVSSLCPGYEVEPLFSRIPTKCVWYVNGCSNPRLIKDNETKCRFRPKTHKL